MEQGTEARPGRADDGAHCAACRAAWSRHRHRLEPWRALRARDRKAPAASGRTGHHPRQRSEEHTSELQSLMRISYAVFCLKKKTQHNTEPQAQTTYTHHSKSTTPKSHSIYHIETDHPPLEQT